VFAIIVSIIIFIPSIVSLIVQEVSVAKHWGGGTKKTILIIVGWNISMEHL
jgi:hypothetical protein